MNILNHMNKNEITDLSSKINMPSEATQMVLNIINHYDFAQLQPHFELLFDIKTGYTGFKAINDLLESDQNKGIIWLAVSLSGALTTLERYRKSGIPDEIFYATMGCLSRFVKEHYESFGVYDFDRAFWSYRQLSQTIYRIGELEFETVQFELDDIMKDDKVILEKGENIISVHIPSDGKINREYCEQAYKSATEFFEKYYPQFKYTYFYCESWIMSPHLAEVLPATSNILAFQNIYELCNEFPDDTSYILWVYKNDKLEPTDFPEQTSLQRNIKQYVQSGKKLGAGDGIINKNKFM